MVPGRKFSTSTSLFTASLRTSASPSGALRLSATLRLLRFTAMKYVASPPTNGGQRRVSSPLPGSSTLMTSAPISPSIIVQKGPARTRVRSRTRAPASGSDGTGRSSSAAEPLDQAAGDGAHAVAGVAGAAPEQARALECAEMREVVHIAHGPDRHTRADPHAALAIAVTDESRAAFELDQGDLQRRAEAFRRRVQRGEGGDLADARHQRRRNGHGKPRTAGGRRRHHGAAAGTG